MGNPRKNLTFLHASATYLVGEVVCRAVTFLYVPVVTRWLGPAEFGGLQLAISLVAILVFISNLSMDNAIIRFVPNFSTAEEKSRFVSTVVVSGLCTSVVFAAIFRTAGPHVLSMLSLDQARYQLLDIVAVAIPAFQLRATAVNVMRAENRPVHFAVVTLMDTAGAGAFGIAALWLLNGGAETFLAAQVFSTYLATGMALWFIRDRLTFKISVRDFFRRAAAYSFPLMLLDAGTLAFSFVDRFALSRWWDLNAVGVYALGVKIALPVSLVGVSINRAFLPYVFGLANPHDKVRIEHVQRIAVGALAGAAFFTVALAQPLVLITGGPAFMMAADLAVLLVPVAAMQLLPRMVGVGLLVQGRTKLLSASVLVASLLDLGLVVLLVPRLSVFGAGFAALLAWGVAIALIWSLAPNFARPRRLPLHFVLAAAAYAGLWALSAYRKATTVSVTSLTVDVSVAVIGTVFLFVSIAGRGNCREILRLLPLGEGRYRETSTRQGPDSAGFL